MSNYQTTCKTLLAFPSLSLTEQQNILWQSNVLLAGYTLDSAEKTTLEQLLAKATALYRRLIH